MASYTTVEANAWIEEHWHPGIQAAFYNRATILPFVLDLTKPGAKVHFRKHANLAIQTLPGGTAGSNINPTANTEVEVTGLPKTVFVYTEVNRNVIARMMEDPLDTLRPSAEDALAEGSDIECAKLATDFTASVVGGPAASVTEPTFRSLMGSWRAATKKGNKGTRPVFIIHTSQWNDAMGEPRFTEQQYTGDGSVLLEGAMSRNMGADWYDTNNIQNTGGQYRNMLIFPNKSIGVGYNQKARAEVQSFLMASRLIAWWDAVFSTLWQEYSGLYNTQ